MFLQIDEPLLIERKFEKVYMKDNAESYTTYYYKQGIYVKFFFERPGSKSEEAARKVGFGRPLA